MRQISETIKVLVISNVLFFLGTLVSGEAIYQFFSLYYFDNPQFSYWQPLTHMFMHGGWMHLLFNMYALWAFGAPLEAQWGRNKFLFFYFSAGLGAALIHSLVNWYYVSGHRNPGVHGHERSRGGRFTQQYLNARFLSGHS